MPWDRRRRGSDATDVLKNIKELLNHNGSSGTANKKAETPRTSKWEAILQKQSRNKKAEIICQKCMVTTWVAKSCCRSCSGSLGWWLEPAGLPPTGPAQPWNQLQKTHGGGPGGITVKTCEPVTPVTPLVANKKGEGCCLDQAVVKHRKALSNQEKAESDVADALTRLREAQSALTAAQTEEKLAAHEVEQARREVATKLEPTEETPIPFDMMAPLLLEAQEHMEAHKTAPTVAAMEETLAKLLKAKQPPPPVVPTTPVIPAPAVTPAAPTTPVIPTPAATQVDPETGALMEVERASDREAKHALETPREPPGK